MAKHRAAHQLSAHAAGRSDSYERRRPEETVLYQTIAADWSGFRERMEESGGLPKFVINLYGKQWIDGRDRKQLERLARYITRPPVAQERLSLRPDGTLLLEFKKVWKDGTRALVLSPDDLLVRLCAAVAPPRFHMLRYFGVLSSHSAFRARVVPEPPEDTTAHRTPPSSGDQLELLGETDDRAPKASRHRWAWPVAHIFSADLERCPMCNGTMRWAEVARTESVVRRPVAKLGLAPHPPPTRPATRQLVDSSDLTTVHGELVVVADPTVVAVVNECQVPTTTSSPSLAFNGTNSSNAPFSSKLKLMAKPST